MAKLIGVTGEFKDREYPLEEGEITIGRKTDNAILLDNPTISSHHCVLTLAGTSCTLQDLDSTNGCRLNGRSVRVEPAEIHHKDILQLGDIEFIVDAPELSSASVARYTDADAEVTTDAMAAPISARLLSSLCIALRSPPSTALTSGAASESGLSADSASSASAVASRGCSGAASS